MSVESIEFRPVGYYPTTGIDVLIVGAGLAGLTCVLECVRKGHSVRILERSTSINTKGDIYFMGLSATRWLKHWPEMRAEYDSISLHDAWIETFKHSGEQMVKPILAAERLTAAGLDPNMPPGTFQMRPLIYKMLLRQVERLGVNIEFDRRVTDYYEDEVTGKGGCITDEGIRYEADIVIAADGVGSKSQKLVGGQVRARSSGRAIWRAAFPIETLDKSPEVKDFFKLVGPRNSQPILRTFLGPGTYALTLTRPDAISWILNHKATESSAENWNNKVDSAEVLSQMDKDIGPQPWAPVFKELVKCSPPNTIVNFELLWRDPQPSWSSPGGRVIQIGDAAHSYLPTSSNGATQAIEDAVSLASCLQLCGEKARITEAVHSHIRFRFTRNSCAQKLGFSNAPFLQETNWNMVKLDPRQAQPKMPKWVWTHDPEAYAHQHYKQNVVNMRAGIRFDESDVPPNFPPGYRYEPWTIDYMMDCMHKGILVDLGPGDWE